MSDISWKRKISPTKSDSPSKSSVASKEELETLRNWKGDSSKDSIKHEVGAASVEKPCIRQLWDLSRDTDLSIKFDEIVDSLLKISHQHTPIELSQNAGNCSPPHSLHLKPAIGRHEQLSETIKNNACLIISGTPGYVKSMEIIQTLYEEGYTRDQLRIGITEPRKQDAMSMSHLLSYHMNLKDGEISYGGGHSSVAMPMTKINYLTNEMLLKEIQMDPMLSKFSVIVINEAQERTIFSDILLGFLSCIAQRRNQFKNSLKLIVMSETKDIYQFWRQDSCRSEKPLHLLLDCPAPLVHIHYTANLEVAWMGAYDKICDLYLQWPPGNILVFLSDKDEVMALCRRLNERFSSGKTFDCEDISTGCSSNDPNKNSKRIRIEGGCSRFSSTSRHEESKSKRTKNRSILHIVPLFSSNRIDPQRKLVDNFPDGNRYCFVTTTISDVPLSIRNIKYVIDSGKVKTKSYDVSTGVFSFTTSWVSKASADKRAGLSEANGHCFRLYTSEDYSNQMSNQTSFDIHKKPIDDTVLTLSSLQIPLLRFPCNQIQSSVARLTLLEALEEKRNASNERSLYITRLGQMMSDLPISARFAKMITKSFDFDAVFTYVILVVCGLAVEDFIVQWSQDIELPDNSQSWLLGEIMTILIVIIGAMNNVDRVVDAKQSIRPRAFQEFNELRCQLLNKISEMHPYVNLEVDSYIKLPSNDEIEMLRLVVFSGSVWNIARKITDKDQMVDATLVNKCYRMINSIEPAFLHSYSPYANELPTWIMYQEAYRNDKNARIFLKGVSVIDPSWLYEYAPSMCVLSEPLDEPSPRYDPTIDRIVCHRSATFGNHEWCLPPIEKPYPICHQVYVWAAYFFLEGELCPPLKKFRHLLHDPSSLTRQESSLERRAHDIIRAFELQDCYSYGRLVGIWELKPTFLLKEYQLWFQKASLKPLIQNMWPKLRNM